MEGLLRETLSTTGVGTVELFSPPLAVFGLIFVDTTAALGILILIGGLRGHFFGEGAASNTALFSLLSLSVLSHSGFLAPIEIFNFGMGDEATRAAGAAGT